MSNVAHIVERYESTIQSLTEQVQTQQQQIHELKSLLLYTMEQQQQQWHVPTEVVRVVPIDKTTKRVSALEADSNRQADDDSGAKKLYVYNSEEHELHWKSLVDGMVKEALYTHLTRLDEQLACSMADRLRRVTREHVVSSVDKEFRRLRREAALDQGKSTIEGVTDGPEYNNQVNHSYHHRYSQNQSPTTNHKSGINVSRHSQPLQDEGRRTSSVHPQGGSTSSLMNQSRTLVDDIRRLKSMLGGGSSLNTSNASANFNNSTDEVKQHVHQGGGVGSTRASELTERLLSKLKSKDRLSGMYSQQQYPDADVEASQITPADTTDPHHRPKSAKRRHRGDDNVSPVTSPQHIGGSRVDPHNPQMQGDDSRSSRSSTVFYRKPQSGQPHHPTSTSQLRGGLVQTGMEWSHLEEDVRPSAMVDMSRHHHN